VSSHTKLRHSSSICAFTHKIASRFLTTPSPSKDCAAYTTAKSALTCTNSFIKLSLSRDAEAPLIFFPTFVVRFISSLMLFITSAHLLLGLRALRVWVCSKRRPRHTRTLLHGALGKSQPSHLQFDCRTCAASSSWPGGLDAHGARHFICNPAPPSPRPRVDKRSTTCVGGNTSLSIFS